MSQTAANQPPVILLLTQEQMTKILSSRRSITSAEFDRQMEAFLGRPLSPARKKTCVNGQEVWVCC